MSFWEGIVIVICIYLICLTIETVSGNIIRYKIHKEKIK